MIEAVCCLYLQGEDESQGSHLLFDWSYRESKPLLQTLHHMDQSEDPQNLCAEEHV